MNGDSSQTASGPQDAAELVHHLTGRHPGYTIWWGDSPPGYYATYDADDGRGQTYFRHDASFFDAALTRDEFERSGQLEAEPTQLHHQPGIPAGERWTGAMP
jgi:hypothetical protein